MGLSAGLLMASGTLASSYGQSQAARTQGEFQRSQSLLNASLMETQAQDAIERGNSEANVARRRATAVAGSQRAAMAAQGLDVTEGSAAETIASTQNIGAVDEMNIRTNAWRTAWGFRQEASNARFEGEMAQIAGDGAAKQTMIAGGLQAFGQVAGGMKYAKGGGQTPVMAEQTRTQSDGRMYMRSKF